MNQQVVEIKQGAMADRGRMAVADVVQQAMAIQEVMRAVMKQNVHFGVIPGTDKPTLYKAGAEKLCLTFHIADEYRVDDLSVGSDAIRYRVTCIGRHQQTGVEMGQGIGEAQTGEEKYRWRKAVCKEEFDATPVNMRRTKYARGKGGSFYTTEQVRTEPADLANTVLKMAAKRAKTAMVLNVLAASDAFGQDLEDLDETLRQHLTDEERTAGTQADPATWPAEAFAAQFTRWEKAVAAGLKTASDILALARSKGALTQQQELQINALVPTASEPAEAAADMVTDPFVAAMNAAEKQHGAAQ